MAIAFGHVVNHSRGKGHSCAAGAAYRTGTRIVDERTGEIHDYTHRMREDAREIMATGIVLPETVAAPSWMRDRSRLWNEADKIEKHPRAVIARDWVLALPHELETAPDMFENMVREMARYVADRHGNAVDFSIHAPHGTDERNFHAHLMMTTRQIGPDGFTQKTRELDKSNTSGKHLKDWRERWTQIVNRELTRAGYDKSHHIDMRSYEAQGLDKQAQKHLGKEAAALERKGERTRTGDFNRTVQAANDLEDQLKIIDLEIQREQRRIAQRELDRKHDDDRRFLERRLKHERDREQRRHALQQERMEAIHRQRQERTAKAHEDRLQQNNSFWAKLTGRYRRTMREIEADQKQQQIQIIREKEELDTRQQQERGRLKTDHDERRQIMGKRQQQEKTAALQVDLSAKRESTAERLEALREKQAEEEQQQGRYRGGRSRTFER